jgi:hypothetical protein
VDASIVMAEIEQAVGAQLRLSGEDPAVAEAVEAVMVALEPAVDRAVARLAEEAAEEVESQLPGRRVRIELRGGVPVLVVGAADEPEPIDTDDLEARITLRLSDRLKGVIEEAAAEVGDSMNTFVVKTLANKAQERSTGRRYTGTIQT